MSTEISVAGIHVEASSHKDCVNQCLEKVSNGSSITNFPFLFQVLEIGVNDLIHDAEHGVLTQVGVFEIYNDYLLFCARFANYLGAFGKGSARNFASYYNAHDGIFNVEYSSRPYSSGVVLFPKVVGLGINTQDLENRSYHLSYNRDINALRFMATDVDSDKVIQMSRSFGDLTVPTGIPIRPKVNISVFSYDKHGPEDRIGLADVVSINASAAGIGQFSYTVPRSHMDSY